MVAVELTVKQNKDAPGTAVKFIPPLRFLIFPGQLAPNPPYNASETFNLLRRSFHEISNRVAE